MDVAENTLMVLDDDRVLALLISRVAEYSGYRVRSFSDPDEFLAAVREDPPTHVAMDLLMPGMDGIEVLRQLALEGCRSAVIIISGQEHKVLEVARATAIGRGLRVSGVLAKPVRPRDLIALLEAGAGPLIEGREGEGVLGGICDDSLCAALDFGPLTLHLAPRVSLADRRISGVEARLGLGQGQDREPLDVIGSSLEPRLQDALFEHYVLSALDWFSDSPLQRSGGKLALRLCATAIEDFRLADRIEAACNSRGVAPSAVTLQIAAAWATGRTADSFDTLTRLRLKGFRLGLDDFGAGYSSFVQLVRLPLSEVKIDACFVAELAQPGDASRIVDAILHLAEGMGLSCVADGVEHETTLAALAAKGCQEALGPAVGAPCEVVPLGEWIGARVVEEGGQVQVLADPGIHRCS